MLDIRRIKGVFLVWLAWFKCMPVIGQNSNIVCRIGNPLSIGNNDILKSCMYTAYSVEVNQDTNARSNKLLSLYGGTAACEYFGRLISTAQGQCTLASIVLQQLETNSFQGIDLRCDPTRCGICQNAFSSSLHVLRRRLGEDRVIMVHIENPELNQNVVDTLNAVVDLVSVPHPPEGCDSCPRSVVPNLIARGLAPCKIVVDIPLSTTPCCPSNDETVLNSVDTVRNYNLLGATIQLDCDDVHNKCGLGAFPLTRKLTRLFAGSQLCGFKGFVSDARDRTRFFSCMNGALSLHRCPQGQLFDPKDGTCIPFLKINCNQTTCTILGPVTITNDTQFLPIVIPFPQCPTPRPQVNLINNTFTKKIIIKQSMSELLKLLNSTGLENTIGILNDILKGVYPPINNVVGILNSLLGNLLLGRKALHATNDKLPKMHEKLGLLEGILKVVIEMIKNLTSIDLSGLDDVPTT